MKGRAPNPEGGRRGFWRRFHEPDIPGEKESPKELHPGIPPAPGAAEDSSPQEVLADSLKASEVAPMFPPQGGPSPFQEPTYPWTERDLPISGIYEVFRRQIVNLCSLRRTVENRMLTLRDYYRSSVGPTRLGLVAWPYPKGSSWMALYWCRLIRRSRTLEDGSCSVLVQQRRQWYRRLKIRNRSEMRSHLFWYGLESRRDFLLKVYERSCTLNRAHTIIARRTPLLVGTFRSALKPLRSLEEVARAKVRDPVESLLNGSGHRLLSLAWAVARQMEILVEDLNASIGRRGMDRIRIFSVPDWKGEPDLLGESPVPMRWYFQDPCSGFESHSWDALMRMLLFRAASEQHRIHFGDPDFVRLQLDQGWFEPVESVLGAIRKIGDRMEEIRRETAETLGSSEPIEEYYSRGGW